MLNARFDRSRRLLQASDFKAVFDGGEFRASHKYFLILAQHNNSDKQESPLARLGLVMSKKNIRRAVDRNRVKRIVRECFRQDQMGLAGLDIIVMSRNGIAELTNKKIVQLLGVLFENINRQLRTRTNKLANHA